MAIGAGLRFGRVIKAARALAADAGGLPVVVIVEAALPAVIVHRHVKMHLVASGAEFRTVLLHEWLHEGLPVRLGIQIGQEVIERADIAIAAGGEFVQRGILDGETAVAHGGIDIRYRMARDATEAVLRFGRIDLFFDRLIESPVEKHRVIVTPGAPFAGLGADDILH